MKKVRAGAIAVMVVTAVAVGAGKWGRSYAKRCFTRVGARLAIQETRVVLVPSTSAGQAAYPIGVHCLECHWDGYLRHDTHYSHNLHSASGIADLSCLPCHAAVRQWTVHGRLRGAAPELEFHTAGHHPPAATKLSLQNVGSRTARFWLVCNGRDYHNRRAIVDRLLSPQLSDHQRAAKLWAFVVDQLYHYRHGYQRPPEDFVAECTDMLNLLNVYGYGVCGDQATGLASLWSEAGLRTRCYTLRSQAGVHSVAEAYYGSAWHMFDPDLAAFAFGPTGQVAATRDLLDAPYATTGGSAYAGWETAVAGPVTDSAQTGRASLQHGFVLQLRPQETLMLSRDKGVGHHRGTEAVEPPAYAAGTQTYSPCASDLRNLAHGSSAAEADAVAVAASGGLLQLRIPMISPFPAFGGIARFWVRLDERDRCELTVHAGAWEQRLSVSSGPPPGCEGAFFPVEASFLDGLRAVDYKDRRRLEFRVSLHDGGGRYRPAVRDLTIRTMFQLAPRTWLGLQLGKNSLRVKSAEAAGVDLRAAVTYVEDAIPTSYVVKSTPSEGATDVPIDAVVTLRYAGTITARAVTATSVSLHSPDGVVRCELEVDERRRILQVTPCRPLQPRTTYLLIVLGDVFTLNTSIGAILGLPEQNFYLTFTTGLPRQKAGR